MRQPVSDGVFNSWQQASEFCKEVRWPAGAVSCPNCSKKSQVKKRKDGRYYCRYSSCKGTFSFKKGTFLENIQDRSLPDLLFVLIYYSKIKENLDSKRQTLKDIGCQIRLQPKTLRRYLDLIEKGKFRKDFFLLEVQKTLSTYILKKRTLYK